MQKNIRILLVYAVIGFTFLTVLVVMAGVFSFGVTEETAKILVKWGVPTVLGELMALFAGIVKWAFKGHEYVLIITIEPDLLDYGLNWDDKSCTVKFGETEETVTPALSNFGSAWEVRLPHEIAEKIKPTDPVSVKFKDKQGHEWGGHAAFLFQQSFKLTPVAPRSRVLSDYGVTNE